MHFKILSLFFVLLMAVPVQEAVANTDEQLAVQYYRDGEYEEALKIFERLFFDNPHSSYYYEYYFNSMVRLGDYDKAQGDLRRLVRQNPDNLSYVVDLGYIYYLQGNERRSRREYEKVLDELPANQSVIQRVANTFYRRNEVDLAIETYLKGRRLLNDQSLFSYQIARFYRDKDQYDKMFDEYLGIINHNPQFLSNIQGNVQELVEDEAVFEMFRDKLMDRIQDDPGTAEYTELLSWLYTQKQDFNSAFIQLRAVDRRLNEQGKRLLDLAEVCKSNNEYRVARQIYQYITETYGERGRYYLPARRGLLDVQYVSIISDPDHSLEELKEVETAYQNYLDAFGMRQRESANVLFRLAELKALYLNKVDEAISLLEELVNSSNVSRMLAAEAKLSLAKFHVLEGRSWQATLLYGQIEREFKDHPIGHEAKFSNAKLSFYRGDFDWALAQLHVLKGSTSELIANDALQLSLLIKDHLALDTTSTPLKMFANADLLAFQNRFEEAMLMMDQILEKYPGHSLEMNILFAKGEIMKKQRRFEDAANFFEAVYTRFEKEILADNALWKAANIYLNNLNDQKKAEELFEQIILRHPDSIFVFDSRKQYRILRGDIIN